MPIWRTRSLLVRSGCFSSLSKQGTSKAQPNPTAFEAVPPVEKELTRKGSQHFSRLLMFADFSIAAIAIYVPTASVFY